MGGLRIAGNIMTGIGLFFFLISAIHNYSGSTGMTFLAIGFCLFVGGMALSIAGKGVKSRARVSSQKTEPSPYQTDEGLEQYEYGVTCPHYNALILMKKTYTLSAQCPICKNVFTRK